MASQLLVYWKRINSRIKQSYAKVTVWSACVWNVNTRQNSSVRKVLELTIIEILFSFIGNECDMQFKWYLDRSICDPLSTLSLTYLFCYHIIAFCAASFFFMMSSFSIHFLVVHHMIKCFVFCFAFVGFASRIPDIPILV